ncbi:AAA family ATPase [Demequina sp. NBRC 110053]|uniref:AAA family ATPase n=1 Tax=Demequina sp. NBRC 110053 TaxID=1570342 RepID=UPI000A0722F1|nr:AAA family ATPase [Demequina sp. NBRC 110053]
MTTDLLAGIRTGDQLDRMHFPPLAWAVHGILPEGFGIFTGAPKTGKSWAAYGIALAVASGKPAFGKIATGHPRPVLMLALEDGEKRLQARARHLLDEGQPIPANLHYLTVVNPHEWADTIAAWLEVHGDRDPLVVLDTLGKVMPPSMPGEGAYNRDYRIGSKLKALADAHPGTCLIVVHHTNKRAAGDDWMDSTSGTNGLNGAADFTVTLTRTRGSTAGTLKVTGRDVPESEYAVTSDDGRWTLDGNTLADAARAAFQRGTTDGLGDRSAEILAYVASQADPVSPKQVDDALDIPDARVYLKRLADSGRLGRAGRGLYVPVTTVTVSLSDEALPLESNEVTDVTPRHQGGDE